MHWFKVIWGAGTRQLPGKPRSWQLAWQGRRGRRSKRQRGLLQPCHPRPEGERQHHQQPHPILVDCLSALWVKSGNRGNLKCLKVNNHFALIFYRKIFITFLSDAKLSKVYDLFLGLIIHVKYLRSNFQKT